MTTQNLSRFLKIVCILGAITKPLWVAAYWITNGFDGIDLGYFQTEWHPIPTQSPFLPLTELHPLLKCAAFFNDLALTAFTSLAFWLGYRLFREYQSGTFFSQNASVLIRKTGMLILLQQCFYPIHTALYTLIMTISNPPGQRMIEVSIGSAQLELLILALILLVGSQIMAKAHELHEETQATV